MVRSATARDAEVVGRLLHDFNREFDNRGGRPDGPLNYFYEREL